MSNRNENDFILVPYNHGRHWVLVVIDIKEGKCYYLDSLKHSTINQQLKQIIEAAMLVYSTQNGSDKRINLMWEQVRVPKQPGNTECGYYVCKFMKEIIDNGLDVLVNANIGDGKQVYKDVDLDGIREDWAHYVSNFETLGVGGKCYYLDSLKHSTINQQLKQIIEAAMLVYSTQNGSDKRINLMWEQVRVTKQPGNTECGYYVCKFMKKIIDNGLDVLVNANIGDGKQVYKDVDLDGIREDWAHYVSNFVLA
ncbi:hypothetical protein LXL04_005047 [Taraxacum kok-saghyz]